MSSDKKQAYRILVVDDERIVQSLVCDALEEVGYVVETAFEGHEAMEKLVSHQYDLLITDIRMPGMDGIELGERAMKMAPSMGVIYMTGYANLNSAKDAIKQGALDYVMKPFELSEIRQAVVAALAKLEKAEHGHSDQQLASLSDLSDVLFAAGDRRSLVRSSLKFAMMHLQSHLGSILYWDDEAGEYVMLSICGDTDGQVSLGLEPLQSLLDHEHLPGLQEPVLVSSVENHPLYVAYPNPDLRHFFFPSWLNADTRMITVPVMRSERFLGMMMLGYVDDTVKVKKSDLRFLAVMASQLATTLQNLTLLEETQTAYGRLKELQDQTIELEKMATRGEMSAEIGHELNNFLGVVVGNVGLLDQHLKSQKNRDLDKYVAAVTDTIGKIRQFTAGLMDLSTISSQKEEIRFDTMIAEVVEYLRPQRRFQGVEIRIPAEIPTVLIQADSTQIQQLFYNIFNNAADATMGCPERLIEVGIEMQTDTKTFNVSVKDTGSGLEPQQVAKAFREKFTTKPRGHGFGLVVSKRIIDNHGGEVSIESSPGQGTTICVTFPLATNTAPVSSIKL